MIEQCQVIAYSKSENAVQAAMAKSYFAAKKDMASCLVLELNELCIDQVWLWFSVLPLLEQIHAINILVNPILFWGKLVLQW